MANDYTIYGTGTNGLSIGALWNNISGANQTATINSIEAEKQRDWQEYMSNTAYQRAVADMENAGINPAMAMSGGGASTPSGASGNATANGNVTSIMSAGAQLAKAFNYDKNKSNDISANDVVNIASNLAKILA